MIDVQTNIILWVSNMEKHTIAAFPTMNLFVQEEMDSVFSCVKQYFWSTLRKLQSLNVTYLQQNTLKKSFWVNDPFEVDVLNLDLSNNIKEELIEIQSDELLKERLKNRVSSFWVLISNEKRMSGKKQKLTLSFATNYMCEAGFTALVDIKTKKKDWTPTSISKDLQGAH